jgi:hypothetical protein
VRRELGLGFRRGHLWPEVVGFSPRRK